MVQKRVFLSFILLAGPIVVPAQWSVKPGSDGLSDGSPLPLPKPTSAVKLMADGSPLPIPKPTALVADGSPLPIPKPNSAIVQPA